MGKITFGKIASVAGDILWSAAKQTTKTMVKEGEKHRDLREANEHQLELKERIRSQSDVALTCIITDSRSDPHEKKLATQELKRRSNRGEPFSDVALEAIRQHEVDTK